MGGSGAALAERQPRVIWRPQPGSQQLFLTCPFFECLYEGTRGPGKTDALLMDFAQHVGRGFGPAWRGIIFRREYKELADLVTKSKKWFRQIFPEARFLESMQDYKWRWPTGEELLFRTFKRRDDYWSYHGHEYPFVAWEELCTWPDLTGYHDMKSVCRSSDPDVPRKYRATANPYGPGHNVVKDYFIDPAPPGVPIAGEHGRKRVRIHGTIWENRALLDADPNYLETLQAEPDPNKRKAWLEGSWDIVAGGMFDDVWSTAHHVVPWFEVPGSWKVDRSFDWGSSRPFSVGWWAESDGSDVTLPDGSTRLTLRGDLFRVAEWYGWNGQPNEGSRMLAREIARGIVEREQAMGLSVSPGPADSSIFDVENGQCLADDMAQLGVRWEKADKSPGSRRTGAEQVRAMLAAAVPKAGQPREEPGLFVFDTCRHFIRTVPTLPRDDKDPEDVDTDAEDHVYDETRYRVRATSHIVTRRRTRGF